MLIENSLFGVENKIDIAIDRITMFSDYALMMNKEGYFVCISGGKDSSVILDLVLKSEVPAVFYHQLTGIDHPETIYFIRREQKRLSTIGRELKILIPRYRNGSQRTMWRDIETYGLPSRGKRWCCRRLKEWGGSGRYCITGIRWAESNKRSRTRAIHEHLQKNTHFNSDNNMNRKLQETCLYRQKMVLNPIIEWSDADVWEYIKTNNLPINPLYDQGFERVGCIGCPLPNTNTIEKYPRYYALYKKAAQKFLDHKKEIGSTLPKWMENIDIYMNTWIKGKALTFPELDFELDSDPPEKAFFSQKVERGLT